MSNQDTQTTTNETTRDGSGAPVPLMVATFETTDRAESALLRLFRAGIHHEQISVATPEGTTLDFPAIDEVRDPAQLPTEGAIVGGTVGAAVGGGAVATTAAAVGTVAGIAVAGPLFAGLLTGAMAGGLVGAMVGRGIKSDVADYYEQAVRGGRTLISVEPRDEHQIGAIRAACLEAGADPIEI